MVSRSEILSQLPDAGLDPTVLNGLLEELEGRRLLKRQVVERHLPSRLERPNGLRSAIVSKDYTYAISFGLLSRWIAHKHTLASLLSF
jgi:hypothetical protein